MDAKEVLLKEKLESLLKQASTAAAELQACQQGAGTNYSYKSAVPILHPWICFWGVSPSARSLA